jgi:two-component system, response regulator, stage 0 sporulation protein F
VCISRSPAIVLVDDEPIMLTVLSYALDYLAPNYDVIALQDGAAALALIAQRSVALVITDYHMPGMDGMELIEAMQTTLPACPVGLLTASLTSALAQRAQAAGAAFALDKPFEVAQLAALVREALPQDSTTHEIPLGLDSPHNASGADSPASLTSPAASSPRSAKYSSSIRWTKIQPPLTRLSRMRSA